MDELSFGFGLRGRVNLDFEVPDGNTALVGAVGDGIDDDIELFAFAFDGGSESRAFLESGGNRSDVVSTALGDTTLTTGLAGEGLAIGVAYSANDDAGL
jgi:hypothetical protein